MVLFHNWHHLQVHVLYLEGRVQQLIAQLDEAQRAVRTANEARAAAEDQVVTILPTLYSQHYMASM